jgi:hypothetical protein
MAGTTPTLAFRYPTGPDAPNVPLDLKNLAQDVETQIVGPFSGNLHLLSSSDLRWNGGDTILSRLSAGVMSTASRLLAAQPYFHGYQTVTQTLTTAVAAAISLGGELVDNSNGHSTVTTNSRFVPPFPGYWECEGMVLFNVSTAGDRQAHVRVNGVQVNGGPFGGVPAMNGAGFLPGCCWIGPTTVLCNGTTDYIELWAVHNTGGPLDTYISGVNASTLKCKWVAYP